MSTFSGVKKPRIPGVSNVRAMLQETEVIKKKIVNSSASAPSTSKVTPTPITAGGSGVKRIAHVPKTVSNIKLYWATLLYHKVIFTISS